MPNKKKKNVITGYAIFVRETRDEYQRKGWSFPRNNQDAFNVVSPLWKKLSEEERQRYNDRAKDEKRKSANDLECKFNALGASFAELENEKREEEESLDIMKSTIKNTVRNSDFDTTFKTQKFYLCHVNYFYANSNQIYKPAEIALSEFNLKKGVLRRFHAFIDPGPIETGYRFEAKSRLEETHMIPIEDPNWTCAERDYGKLFMQIKNFLCKDNPNGRIPPIYSMSNDMKNNYSLAAVQSTIETLCEACDEDPSQFRVYALHLLYHELRLKALSESSEPNDVERAQFITVSMALHDLEKDKFCYSKGIACEFHEEKDVGNFCSLSIVTRLVYTICDFMLNYIDEPIVQGGHAPRNSVLAKEIYQKDKDGFQVVPLRKPKVSSKETSSEWTQPSTSKTSGNKSEMSYARSIGGNNSGNGFDTRKGNYPVPGSGWTSNETNNENDDEAPESYSQNNFAQPRSQMNSGFSYANAMRGNTSAPPAASLPKPSLTTQLRFQSPRKFTQSEDDAVEDETPDSIYEDAGSSLPTPNLSQSTVLSGYTASASLSQSSYASDVSNGVIRFLGRGRGGIRLEPTAAAPMNWASVAGRGARMKPTNQPKYN